MRKKILSVVLALWVLTWALPAYPLVIKSDLGFRLTFPSNWSIVTKNDVKGKPDMVKATFEAAEKEKTLSDFPKELYSTLKERISGGNVEYYYKTDSPQFTISVYEETGKIAQSKADIKNTCESLPGELSKMMNRSVKVHECTSKKVGDINALYLVVDSYREGERYIQYLIQKSPDKILLLTASPSKGQNFEAIKTEFNDVMKSFKLTS